MKEQLNIQKEIVTKDSNQVKIKDLRARSRSNTYRRDQDRIRHHSFIDNSIEGIWRLDLEKPIPLELPALEQVELLYRHVYFGEVNKALAEQYGFDTPEEIIGFRLEEILPRDTPSSIPLLKRVVEANYRLNDFETVEQDRYGNRKVFKNNLAGEIKDGKLLRMWGTSRDITYQKQLEKEFRLHTQAFEQIPDACVIVEATSEKFAYINAGFMRLTGYSVSDIPDTKLSFLQGADTDPKTVSEIREAVESEKSFRGEILNYKKDGTPFWNLMRISPIRNAEGAVTHYVGILTDLTEQKRTEAMLLEQRNALAHLTRVATIGELTAALTHELNQPLTAILSNAQAALRFLDRENPDVDEAREILNDIVADDKRAGEVMRRVRRLVKRDSSHFERLDINHLIEEVKALVGNDLAIRRISFSTLLAPELPAVLGDSIQLQQVILNLIMNACHAVQHLNTDKRQIKVSTKSVDGQTVAITVTDFGRGIDEKILDHIFEPFFSTKGEGLGMGLAINRTIVEAHGGRLWAENSPNQGAVFHVILPITP